jgi:predicted HTH transcriptional regulator
MPDYIKRRITEGEHQRLEFKFEVSDFRKIARTLVAFSNTDGGSLLIGVKDNGAIAGVRSEEEYFMIEGAAKLYCRPEITFHARQWQTEGKKVMEVMIGQGNSKPYLAQDDNDQWIAYIRQGDQNLKAGKLLLEVWERQRTGESTTIHFRQAEKTLLLHLEQNESITQSKFRRLAGLSASQSEKILVDFIMLGLISLEHTPTAVLFQLTQGYLRIIESSGNIIK